MKCDLCAGKDVKIEYGRAVLRELPFDLPTLTFYVEDSMAKAEMTVKYCPLCGKRLEDV